MEIVQDLLAEQAEDGDHAEGDGHRLPGHGALDLGGLTGGQGEKDWRDPGRVHDHEEGEEKRSEYGEVEHG